MKRHIRRCGLWYFVLFESCPDDLILSCLKLETSIQHIQQFVPFGFDTHTILTQPCHFDGSHFPCFSPKSKRPTKNSNQTTFAHMDIVNKLLQVVFSGTFLVCHPLKIETISNDKRIRIYMYTLYIHLYLYMCFGATNYILHPNGFMFLPASLCLKIRVDFGIPGSRAWTHLHDRRGGPCILAEPRGLYSPISFFKEKYLPEV